MNHNTHLIYVIILRLFINGFFLLLLKHNEKMAMDTLHEKVHRSVCGNVVALTSL